MMTHVSSLMVLVLLLPAVLTAQEYTFTLIDIPALGGASNRLITLVGLANDGTIAGDDQSAGGFGSRLSPGLDVLPVLCDRDPASPAPRGDRGGPEVTGMNNVLTVVGTDDSAAGQIGFVQELGGDCRFFAVPGAVGTLFSGINDLGRIVGQYFNDPALESGLLRFHGFVKDGDTVTPLTDGSPTDILFPTRINAAGEIIGYAFRDVQADNSYLYQAFVLRDGVVTWVQGPAGEDVTLTGLNNAGVATAVLHAFGVIGGPAVLYNTHTGAFTSVPLPTPDTIAVLPTAINDLGAFVGLVDEFLTDVPDGRTVLHQFLAIPVPPIVAEPPPPEEVPPPRHRKRFRHHVRERLREVLHDAKWHNAADSPLLRRWRPVLDDDGSVCLTDGARVVGRRP